MSEEAKSPNEVLLAALVCGASVETAARKAGIARRTAYRRLKDPRFAKRLQAARAEITKRTTSLLSAGSLEAVKALMDLIAPSVAPATRLGAARAIIELAAKLREQTEMEERLAALEERLEANGGKPVYGTKPGRN